MQVSKSISCRDNVDVLVATDIRFWELRWGNYARIFALVRHLLRNGYCVGVLMLSGVDIPSEEEMSAMLAAMGDSTTADGGPLADRLVFISSKPSGALLSYAKIRGDGRRLLDMLTRTVSPILCGAWVKVLADVTSTESFYSPRHLFNVVSTRKVVDRLAPSVVIVEYIHYAYLIPCVRSVCRPPQCVALDTIDVQSRRALGFKERKIKHWLDIDETTELRVADMADLVLAIQPDDARFFREGLKRASTLTVMHGFKVRNYKKSDSLRVLFVGGKIDPNRLGIQEFIEKGWPIVQQALGGSAVLRIAGHVCDRLKSISSLGVELLGYVPDLDTEYDSAAVVIAPIYFGGGLQIKVVEALCRGKAVVCAPRAVHAFHEGANHAFSVVDTPEHMAKEVVRLLMDETARHALEMNALQFAQKHFSEEACYSGLDVAIDAAIKSFRGK